MQKQITLKQDKITKGAVRYKEATEQFPLQIYLRKDELTASAPTSPVVNGFPQEIVVTISW